MKYQIALVAEKAKNIITYREGIRDVKVVKYNKNMDYAIIELAAEPYDLIPIPISRKDPGADEDIKVFHFPVADFNDH